MMNRSVHIDNISIVDQSISRSGVNVETNDLMSCLRGGGGGGGVSG
jgi:hypothetical protein